MKKRLVIVLMTLPLILSGIFTVGAAEENKRVIIGFKNPVDMNMVMEDGGDIKYQYSTIPAIAVNISDESIQNLISNPNIAYIEDDIKVYALAESLSWGVDRIDADMVWGVDGVPETKIGVNTGADVKVAIIDTGIDKDHPDLMGNIAGGINFVRHSSSDTLPDNNWNDDNGHGTHVAGIVAAIDNDIGVIGVAPQADLYAVKVLDSSGAGYISDVIAGIDWAATNDMDVISMSLGIDSSFRSLEEACDNAYNSGIVLVAAAGNNRGAVVYPAAYDSVIAVSAITKDDSLASFSSRGPEVELAAPGSYIRSTYKDGYATLSGTSMAAPHVSGTVALMMNTPIKKVYDVNSNGLWDPSEIRQKLADTATDLGTDGRDIYFGYGLINASGAASMVDDYPTESDWNPWDDDCKIQDSEISTAIYYWKSNSLINGHQITDSEISLIIYEWKTGDVATC